VTADDSGLLPAAGGNGLAVHDPVDASQIQPYQFGDGYVEHFPAGLDPPGWTQGSVVLWGRRLHR